MSDILMHYKIYMYYISTRFITLHMQYTCLYLKFYFSPMKLCQNFHIFWLPNSILYNYFRSENLFALKHGNIQDSNIVKIDLVNTTIFGQI